MLGVSGLPGPLLQEDRAHYLVSSFLVVHQYSIVRVVQVSIATGNKS